MDLEGPVLLVVILLGLVAIAMLGGVIYFGYRLLKAYPIISDPDAPRSLKAVFWLAIIYTVSPLDVLPDPIWLDDMLALVGAFAHISNKGNELGLGQLGKHRELETSNDRAELDAKHLDR